MDEYHRGEVVLVRFPFTNLQTTKLRPAVILALHGEDVIVVDIFSTVPTFRKDTWLLLEQHHPHFPQTGLKRTSIVKAEKLTILHQSVIHSKIGSFHPSLMTTLGQLVKQAGLDPLIWTIYKSNLAMVEDDLHEDRGCSIKCEGQNQARML